MKNLLVRISLFITIAIVVFVLLVYKFRPRWNVGIEVRDALELLVDMEKSEFIDTVRLGDSVGKNIFNTSKVSNSYNLTTNQAISFLGQLLIFKKTRLVENKLNKNLHYEGYFRPSSFFNNLNQPWTFNYFIKYFYNSDYFFNSDLLIRDYSFYFDSNYLDQYFLKKFINKSWFNGFSIFTYPKFGENIKYSNNSSKKNLLNTLNDLNLMNEFKSKIVFKSMPIHVKHYKSEFECYVKLKKMGFNISKPMVLNDTFFIEDNIHLKRIYRNSGFYNKFCQSKN